MGDLGHNGASGGFRVKLGFWNRLAIVATVLAILLAPITIMVLAFNDMSKNVDALYGFCMRSADARPPNEMGAAVDRCFDEMSVRYQAAGNAAYSWEFWFQLVSGTLIVCVVLYCAIWAAAMITRWIWRGRRTAS
jgi:hypothetical protein